MNRSRVGRIDSSRFREESLGRAEGPNSEPWAGEMKIARTIKIESTARMNWGVTAFPSIASRAKELLIIDPG